MLAADLEAVLLSVVSEKTGYPEEVLDLEMGLETDLGIDSIKRVEILAAVTEKAPHLPEIEVAEMAQLQTLGQIVAFITAQTGGSGSGSKITVPSRPEVRTLPVKRWEVKLVPAPASGLAIAGLFTAKKAMVTDDKNGVADALVERLGRDGIEAKKVNKVPSDADAVLFLGGLRKRAEVKINRAAFLAAQAVAGDFEGLFVTVQDTGGDFGFGGGKRAFVGGLAGLAKTCAAEWPRAAVRAIDIQRGERTAKDVAEAIMDELIAGGGELEVALSADGRRRTLATIPAEAAAGKLVVNAESFVVAAGGARGVTAAALVELAQESQARFALLGRTRLEDEPQELAGVDDDAALKQALMKMAQAEGRTPTPPELGTEARRIHAQREIRSTLESLQKAGSEARYLSVDITDGEALSDLLEPLRREWGPVTTVVHGAGVLVDKLIAEKTEEQFDLVFDTKVIGLRSLLRATQKDDLTGLVLFSSVAARYGNTGQCDYAMANEVLNKVAQAEARRRGSTCVVRSLNWGPWEGGMVTPPLKTHFEAKGIPLIPLELGSKMFVDELRGPGAVEVVIGGPAGRGLGDESADSEYAIRVDKENHPYLADHTIKDAPVLPAVMALEWFVRAAKAARPDLDFASCHDLSVMNGINLGRFENGGDVFTIRCHSEDEGDGAVIDMQLKGVDGTLHYTAGAVMQPESNRSTEISLPDLSLKEWTGAIYDNDVLFHGPEFRVIRQVDGVSDGGISGSLAGTQDMGWNGVWSTDPAALEGGLQLAGLWTNHQLGGASLPVKIGSYHHYEGFVAAGPLQCILSCKVVGKLKTVSDIIFSRGGDVLAELRAVEAVLRP